MGTGGGIGWDGEGFGGLFGFEAPGEGDGGVEEDGHGRPSTRLVARSMTAKNMGSVLADLGMSQVSKSAREVGMGSAR
jgi:hypothetical protein